MWPTRLKYLTVVVLCLAAIALALVRVWNDRASVNVLWGTRVLAATLLLVSAILARRWRLEPPKKVDEVTRWRRRRQGAVCIAITFALLATLHCGMVITFVQMASTYTRTPAWTAANVRSLATFAATIFIEFGVAIAQIWVWRHATRRLRQAQGRCPKCGYLLTGLPEPRCPECGTPFVPVAPAAEVPASDR